MCSYCEKVHIFFFSKEINIFILFPKEKKKYFHTVQVVPKKSLHDSFIKKYWFKINVGPKWQYS